LEYVVQELLDEELGNHEQVKPVDSFAYIKPDNHETIRKTLLFRKENINECDSINLLLTDIN
jgi:hypothetical protein